MKEHDDVPTEYRGLWRRQSVALGGAPASEPALALWWQGPSMFMDIRWRLDTDCDDGDGLSVDRVMAGYTTFEADGFMTWHHEIDSYSGEGADRSAVSLDGDRLIEVGELEASPEDQSRPFVEVWRRQGPEEAEVTRRTTDDAQLMFALAGRWSLHLSWPFRVGSAGSALLECASADTWTLSRSFVTVGADS
jgi:hypothetical protein